MTEAKAAEIEKLIEVRLTRGYVAQIDERDADVVLARKWCADVIKTKVYAVSGKPKLLMHRLITGAKDGQIVDHIDGNGLNNRRSNLRITNHYGNAQNARKRKGAHGYIGVHKHPEAKTRPYYSQFRVNGNTTNAGYFSTAEEAARVYDENARKYYGEFAVLNFPEASQ